MRHELLPLCLIAVAACSETGIQIRIRHAPSLDGEVSSLRLVIGRELPMVPRRVTTYVDRSPPADIDVRGRALSKDPHEVTVGAPESEHMDDAIVVGVFGLGPEGDVVAWGALPSPVRFVEDSVVEYALTLLPGGELPRTCEAANFAGQLIQIGRAPDSDCDGFESDDDCDDLDGTAHPGAHESCADKVDNNCNGAIDESSDEDADGVTNCDGDCNDHRADVYAGAVERCDGVDNNCDDNCDGEYDGDGDHYTTCGSVSSADRTFCVGPRNLETVDCADQDPTIHAAAPERCDGIDNDCSGGCDDEAALDADADGFTTCGSYIGLCGVNPADVDCSAASVDQHPASAERCNGEDDNCDGTRLQSALCLAVGATDCEVGTRACNDNAGGGGWSGSCAISVGGPLLSLAACADYTACVTSAPQDPVACLVAAASARHACTLFYDRDTRQPCPPTVMALPVGAGTCAWRVLGGTAQAAYTVGLAPSISEPPVGDALTDCTAAFAIVNAASDPPRDDRFLLSLSVDGALGQTVGIELTSQPVANCPSQGMLCTVTGP